MLGPVFCFEAVISGAAVLSSSRIAWSFNPKPTQGAVGALAETSLQSSAEKREFPACLSALTCLERRALG